MQSSSWLLWIGLFCIVIAILMCFTDIMFQLSARHQDKNEDVKIKVTMLFGLISFSFRLPKFRVNNRGLGFQLKKPTGNDTEYELEVKDAITQYEIWLESLEIIRGFKQWFLKLLSKVELSNWTWNSRAGTGDAMSTAISCGALWSVKGLLFGKLSSLVKVINSPQVAVQPHFQQKLFATEWSCQLKLKIGNLLLASLYLLTQLTLLRKTRHLIGLLISKA